MNATNFLTYLEQELRENAGLHTLGVELIKAEQAQVCVQVVGPILHLSERSY